MATVNFYTRQKTGKNPAFVYVRFNHGTDIYLRERTNIQVIPSHWDAKKQQVKNLITAKYNVYEINKKLADLKNHIIRLFIDGELEGNDFLKNAIKLYDDPNALTGIPGDLFGFIQYFIDGAPTRLNPKTSRPVSYKMQREYHASFDHLKAFAGKKKIDFKDIDLEFYKNFVEYLQKQKLATNTIGKKIQTLKIFLNAATDMGINTHLKYKSNRFTAPSEETEHIYLTTHELKAIETAELNPELDRIRDLFLIGAWTGLRYSDWNQVADNMQDGMMHIKQQKTRHKIVIPLHPTVLNIVDKYPDGLPKVPTNQHMNRSLKEIAKAAELNEKVNATITKGGVEITKTHEKWELVSTHTARRSFATNAYLMGIPSITIMAVTGHKTESAFLKYIKVTPDEHAEKIREIWSRQAMQAINE